MTVTDAARVTLITGAAGALGGAVARTLVAGGARVALVDHDRARERLEAMAKELTAAGGRAAIVAGDITRGDTWAGALPRIEAELGGPPSDAALIAGGWRGGRAFFEEVDDDTWRTMMTINAETMHRTLRAILPGMVARGHGSIVVVGARAAVQPWTATKSAAYAASKAAVVALAQTVAAEVLDRGVRINAILPSTLDTPANRAEMPNADPAKLVSLDSAAGLIAFLLSDAARDISGAAIPIYGRA
ncbi:MAG: SDR family NAD(P)-dependent oxidoreductase [Gemmatimonadales bacterium]